jgi:deazaflavin-dependent oxidoreductase (nitroreductase family)
VPLPKTLARFNLVVTNRIAGPAARRVPAMAVVIHVGRRSGAVRRTPVNLFRAGDRYVVALTYGPDSQWVRNVLAAGGCEVETRGRRLRLAEPEVVHDPERTLVPAIVRPVLGFLDASDFLVLRSAEEELRGDDRVLRVKAARPELSVFEFEVGAGYEGPGTHFHKEHVDSFYVVEGELDLTLNGEIQRAGPGAFVCVEPGVVHGFTNPGPGGARFLNVHAPGGFEEYLRELDRLAAEGREPDRELHERYDVWEV